MMIGLNSSNASIASLKHAATNWFGLICSCITQWVLSWNFECCVLMILALLICLKKLSSLHHWKSPQLPMGKIVRKSKLCSLSCHFNGQNRAQNTQKQGALATKTSNKSVLRMKQKCAARKTNQTALDKHQLLIHAHFFSLPGISRTILPPAQGFWIASNFACW